MGYEAEERSWAVKQQIHKQATKKQSGRKNLQHALLYAPKQISLGNPIRGKAKRKRHYDKIHYDIRSFLLGLESLCLRLNDVTQ